MLLREYLSSVTESLFVNKVRTALAILGIVIGIAAVVSLLSIGESNTKQIQAQFQKLGTNLVTISGQGSNITPKDLEAVKAQSTVAVAATSPEVSQQSKVTHGKKTKQVLVVGATTAYLQVHNASLKSGTFVGRDELNKTAKTVVLGPELAKYLFGDGVDPIGSKVIIQDQAYTVIGVTAAKGGDAFSSPDYYAFVPIETAQARLFGTKNYSSVSLSLKNSGDAATAKSSLTNLLLARHHIASAEEADFQIQNQQEILKSLTSVSNSMNSLLTTIAAISLIVGGIGIMNVMLVSVIERTSEIGLRKAVGAKKSAIVSQFLGEAIVLTMLGGAIGVLTGYGVSTLILSVTSQPFAFSMPAVALGLGMSTSIGVIFGWYPAWKAAKLSPIEALRYE